MYILPYRAHNLFFQVKSLSPSDTDFYSQVISELSYE